MTASWAWTGDGCPQFVHPDCVNEPVGEATRAMAARIGRAACLCQQQAILDRPDSIGLLPRIAVSTLVAVGEGDQLTPPKDAYPNLAFFMSVS